MRAEFCIAADHPALPGHFPGQPVVPAVVILDAVADRLRVWRPELRLTAVISAKFVAPLRPEECCQVEFRVRDSASVRFACTVSGRPIASGILGVAR